ncbi:hypothetical protein T4E_8378 [Trichinella pseudospiralis]|uniref:Uncharacterized protein n=1 Tax=Trichinella pseudospiralis TaxID=6337 RepID=A0A0V0XG40_TRIPS|nr:hypothetical protein T4E_12250 [Trichinella pseudospiralis]KRX87009.1 hypothetical protein T4E_8378 [Trichinella pseudospiralis]
MACNEPLPRAGQAVSFARLLARASLFGDGPAKTDDDITTTAARSLSDLLSPLLSKRYRTPHPIFTWDSSYGSFWFLSLRFL